MKGNKIMLVELRKERKNFKTEDGEVIDYDAYYFVIDGVKLFCKFASRDKSLLTYLLERKK